MVVRVQPRVVAGRVAEGLKREVGDHLVGVHVGRGAGAALDHVDDEVLVVAAGDDLVTGRGDGGGAGGVERAELAVGERGRLLDHGERPHELGEVRERHAGDREVLERPRGMDAPDRLPRQLLRPERVGFGSEIGHGAAPLRDFGRRSTAPRARRPGRAACRDRPRARTSGCTRSPGAPARSPRARRRSRECPPRGTDRPRCHS